MQIWFTIPVDKPILGSSITSSSIKYTSIEGGAEEVYAIGYNFATNILSKIKTTTIYPNANTIIVKYTFDTPPTAITGNGAVIISVTNGLKITFS